MRSLSIVGVVVLVLADVTLAGPPPELEPLSFLIGEWQASGAGQPGVGTGTAVFSRQLQERVILRTSFAEYPPAAGTPASRHDDLMVVYAAPGGIKADYYDNEGHVIRYRVRSPAAGQAVFVSEASADEPRFRLTYRLEAGMLRGEFAVAPPGVPEAFRPYLTWDSTRKSLGK